MTPGVKRGGDGRSRSAAAPIGVQGKPAKGWWILTAAAGDPFGITFPSGRPAYSLPAVGVTPISAPSQMASARP